MNKTNRSLTTQPKKIKLDRGTLQQEAPDRWRVSGRDSSGCYRRIRFHARTEEEALAKAMNLLKNPSPLNPNHIPPLHIADALIRSSANRDWRPEHRRNDQLNCEQFLKWVESKGLHFWHELRFEHLEEYHKNLRERGLKYDTIRLYLWPVRRAARWVACNYRSGYSDISQGLRLSRRQAGPKFYQETTGNPVLSIAEVLDFLDWLARDPTWGKLGGTVALQGLVGLRLLEAMRLTWQQVDLESGTVTVEGDVKNAYSVRRLPIPRVAVNLLRRVQTVHPEPRPESLITPGYCDFRNYSRAIQKALAQWNPGLTLLSKDLRNTLPTAALDGNWNRTLVEFYMGHSPQNVTERNYFGNQGDRLLPLFRELVVAPLEAEILKWAEGHPRSPLLETDIRPRETPGTGGFECTKMHDFAQGESKGEK